MPGTYRHVRVKRVTSYSRTSVAVTQVQSAPSAKHGTAMDDLSEYMKVNWLDFGAQLTYFLTAVMRGAYAAPHHVVATAYRLVRNRFDPKVHKIKAGHVDDGFSHARNQILFDLTREYKHNLRHSYTMEGTVRL